MPRPTVNKLLKNDYCFIQDGSGVCCCRSLPAAHGVIKALALLLRHGFSQYRKAIRDYFLGGQLLPNGLVCPTNENLFPEMGTDAAAWMTEAIADMEDRRLSGT